MPPLDTLIGNPETQHDVQSPDEYRRYALLVLGKLNRKAVPTLTERPERPGAYVSAGRWVVDCHLCGNGPSAHPVWELAVCCECGAVYVPTFPTNWQAVESVLLARPSPFNRHYFPDDHVAASRGLSRAERLGDLIQENAERGLAVGVNR